MHGKTSPILHDNTGVFAGLPSPFEATRYHSLLIDPPTMPAVLTVNAHTAEGEIMGVRHNEYPIHGVQFHPESILTRHGKELLKNFLMHTRTSSTPKQKGGLSESRVTKSSASEHSKKCAQNRIGFEPFLLDVRHLAHGWSRYAGPAFGS